MADTKRLVGKSMFLTVAGTAILITKATPKVATKYADTTDTGDYDAATDLLYPTQKQASASVEIAVEGMFRVDSTPSAVIAKLFDGTAGPYAVTFGPKTGLSQFSGNYDITDYSQDTPQDDAVKWSATIKSNGKVTP